jgi:cytochrome P450
MAGLQTLDLMEELADQVPMFVICRLLDLPFADYPRLREWVDDPAATPADLEALAGPDEAAWVVARRPYLLY